MAAFQLSKWYLDYVTNSGNTVIAYVGDLHWGPVTIHYSSLLRSNGSSVRQINSLRKPLMPEITDHSASWKSAQFGFSGEWRSDSADAREIVFENEVGAAEWRCLMPYAQTRA